jgi:hypothetical protein
MKALASLLFPKHEYFPVHRKEVPLDSIDYISFQIGVPAAAWLDLEWCPSTIPTWITGVGVGKRYPDSRRRGS